jgi:hypothetical protein
MSYLLTDIKKIYQNKLIIMFLTIMTLVMVFDPLSLFFQSKHLPGFFSGIGDDPYQYWILTNHAGWGHAVYYNLFWAFPVLFTGLILYHEKTSSVYKLMIIRNHKYKYFFAKIGAASFVAFFAMFLLILVNIFVTYLVFPGNHMAYEQYSFFIPQQGTFTSGLFQYSPLITSIFYAVLNAGAVAIFSAIATDLHMLINFKNQYIALIMPILLFYLVSFVFDNLHAYKYNMNIVIQPLATNALVDRITIENVVFVYVGWSCLAVILFMIGIRRNKTVL